MIPELVLGVNPVQLGVAQKQKPGGKRARRRLLFKYCYKRMEIDLILVQFCDIEKGNQNLLSVKVGV